MPSVEVLRHRSAPLALLAGLALVTLSTCLHAQVYRCGSTYSNAPCTGGKAIDTTPPVSAQGSASSTATLYLCQGYGGGQFWSQQHCAKHGALVDRMESVPANLPFDQQVDIASSQRNRGAALATQPAQTTRTETVNTSKPVQCAALDERIRYLDQLARAGGNAQYMDWIANERKQARDRQFGLRC